MNDHRDERFMRTKESNIHSVGQTKPLGRLQRAYKWDTHDLIPDDGFRELNTVQQTHFIQPDKHRVMEKPTLKMINNIGEMPLVERIVSGPKTGFGAVLPTHNQDHGVSSFSTTNGDYFGKPGKKSAVEVVQDFNESQFRNAGDDKWNKQECVKKISGLTGEVFNTAHDPQVASEVQRTWIYRADPAIEAVKKGTHEIEQTMPFDNATSLCIGDGEYEYRKRVHVPNQYRKKRTDITRKQGTKPTLVKF